MVKEMSALLLGLGLGFGWSVQAAMTIVDDVDTALQYSNSGPAWVAGEWHYGGTPHDPYPIGPNNTYMAYNVNYHEAYGDGAWVQLVFTGTRVRVNATVPKVGYSTRVGFYIDGNLVSTYSNELPAQPTPTSAFDYSSRVIVFDQDGLAPAQHTWRAVTIGSDGLFLFDVLEFEASAAVATSAAGASTGATATSSITRTANSTLSVTTTSSLNSTVSLSTSTTSGTTSTDGTNLAANPGTSTVIATVGSNPNANANIATSNNNTKSTTVIAAVIGGLAGIALFILVGFFLLRRWRQKKTELMYEDAAATLPWNPSNNGTQAGSTENGGFGGGTSHEGDGHGSYTEENGDMSQRPWQVPLSQNNGVYQNPPVYPTTAQTYNIGSYPTQAQAPITTAGPIPVLLQRADGSTIDDTTTDLDTDVDSRTYQTLPSYHERVQESAGDAGRNLSQADINAISQRLTEVMRSHIQQSGNPQAPYALNALDQRLIVPPRELIDHLVEERLNPREGL